MGQIEPGQRALHQLRHKILGTEFHQARRAGDDLHLTDGAADGENPLRTREAARIGDIGLVKVVGALLQRNGDELAGGDGFQMRADVMIQLAEAVGQIGLWS